MLVTLSYLTLAAMFYVLVAKRAPIVEEQAYATADRPCEVIELFAPTVYVDQKVA